MKEDAPILPRSSVPGVDWGMQHYRADIDGLRAMAVLAVVAFHAGCPGLGGGYAGVDIFFVISGYLITLYLDRNIAARSFSLFTFYQRRVRRIFPALLFVVLITWLLSLATLLPGDFVRFSKSMIAAVCFVPNILFLNESGYFEAGAKSKPLLHLWSLGVEEQFYIVFPWLLMAIARCTGTVGRRVVAGVALISFVGSIMLVRAAPAAAFYLAPSRAWELMLGALVALRVFPSGTHAGRNILAAFGLIAVLASFTLYTRDTPFPGFAALLPCAGAALLIHANEGVPTAIGRILGSRTPRGIGLISYSLYLWHWPLLVLTEYRLVRPLTGAESLLIVVFSFAAAACTWRLVEQPFRKRPASANERRIVVQAGLGASVILAVAALGLATGGLPKRFSAQALAYDAEDANRSEDWESCLTRMSSKRVQADDMCRLGLHPSAPPRFVMWGDSHAAAMEPAFKYLAAQSGIEGWFAAFPGCPPLLGVHRDGPERDSCTAFNDAMIAAIARRHVPNVILVARWEIGVLGRSPYEIGQGQAQFLLTDAASRSASLDENRLVVERGLRRTLDSLSRLGVKTFLVLDTPNTGLPTPRYLALQPGLTSGAVRIASGVYSASQTLVRLLINPLAAESHVTVVDPRAALCLGTDCLIAKYGQSIYIDDHHLSRFGALQLVDSVRPIFATFAQGKNASSPVH